MPRNLGRVLAWLVTLGVLGYLFSRVPATEVVRAAARAAGWTFPALAVLVLANFLADCFAFWKTFGWFVAPMTYREVVTLRGATYLLALVNYALGQGAIVYFMNRFRGVPLGRGTAAVLLILGINLLLLLFAASAGMAFGAEMLPGLKALIAVAYAGLALYSVLVIVKPRWLVRRPVFEVLLSAGLGGHAKALLVRVPHLIVLMLVNFTILRGFGVEVSIWQTLLCMPVVFLVAVLPISFQGLGPTQGAMVFFFSRYAPGHGNEPAATVLAASLVSQVVIWAVQIPIGIACLRTQLAQRLKEMPAAS